MANIVLIDSEPTVRTVMESILKQDGHSVRATGDFSEAVEMLHSDLSDLVVTNVFLRGIPGHDAMHVLKKKFPSLPVLMVSGLPDHDVISRWNQETGFDVFPKPFRGSALLEKVKKMLGGSIS